MLVFKSYALILMKTGDLGHNLYKILIHNHNPHNNIDRYKIIIKSSLVQFITFDKVIKSEVIFLYLIQLDRIEYYLY